MIGDENGNGDEQQGVTLVCLFVCWFFAWFVCLKL